MRIGVFSSLGNQLVQFEANLCLPREKKLEIVWDYPLDAEIFLSSL